MNHPKTIECCQNTDTIELVRWLSRKILLDFEYCKNIFEKLRPSSYNKFSLRLIPREIRNDIRVVFSFARYIDDLVDEVSSYLKDDAQNSLTVLQKEWEASKGNQFANNPIINSMRNIATKHEIPEEYFTLFFSAMNDDIKYQPIQTFSELENYMYRGSSSLAMIVSHILGYQKREQMAVAKQIGLAMHLTNLLKDIKDDYQQMNRVYIPNDLLQKFGIKPHSISDVQNSDQWKSLIQTLIKQARQYYQNIEENLNCLPSRGRKVAKLTLRIYQIFLTKIEENNYDVFSNKIDIPFSIKVKIFISTLLES
ncbi:hypothetical protein CSB37_01290 [bacterium DOLZORAL124_38_8]|nr:MAG: hypothetical protein CSB37_01290 [bacterium DOLZORAL124_38_8]